MIRNWSKAGLAAGLWLIASIATAQQAILFSQPADLSADKATVSSKPETDDKNLPRPLINSSGASAPMPSLPVSIYQNQNNYNEASKAWNKRKNWNLLTVEEIMGVKSPEQSQNMLGRESSISKLSLEEQFLLRQTTRFGGSTTNSQIKNGLKRNNVGLFGKDRDEPSANFRQIGSRSSTDGSAPVQAWAWNQPANINASLKINGSDPAKPSALSGAFYQPVTTRQSTLEQEADMERFRALLEPQPAPTTIKPSAQVASSTSDNKALHSSTPSSPVHSISTVEVSVNRPAALQTVSTPGKTTPGSAAKSKPGWQAERPPWMSDKPQAPSIGWNHK